MDMASVVVKGVGAKKDWGKHSQVVANTGGAAPLPPSYNSSSGNYTATPKNSTSGIVVRR